MSTFTLAQINAVNSSLRDTDRSVLSNIASGIATTGYASTLAVARLSNQGLVSMCEGGSLKLTAAGQKVVAM